MATKRWKKWLLWLLVLTPVCYAAVIYWRIVNQSATTSPAPLTPLSFLGRLNMTAVLLLCIKRDWTAPPSLFHHGLAPDRDHDRRFRRRSTLQ